MALKNRIIACLDIKNGRTVKGTNFIDLKDAGDPVELAKKYVNEGVDELVFLDIAATNENRKTLIDLVERIAKNIHIPFTVGGGISSLESALNVIQAGADKISLNSAAVKNPQLIWEIAKQLGSQCVVVAVDAKFVENDWYVFTHGGEKKTTWLVTDWVKEIQRLGAGEILLTSMNNDGMKNGFAIDLVQKVTDLVSIPVIASGGAGKKSHFLSVFQETKVTAALAAGVFHFGEIEIPELKKYLIENDIPIRANKTLIKN